MECLRCRLMRRKCLSASDPRSAETILAPAAAERNTRTVMVQDYELVNRDSKIVISRKPQATNHEPRITFLILFLALFSLSCHQSKNSNTLRFSHFWTEP